MTTRKSTCACAGRLPVLTKAMTVGLPRVASELTGRSSTESKAKSIGACTSAFDTPSLSSTSGGPFERPHAATKPTTPTALLVALLTHELIVTVREQHVEGGERAIAAGDVLLELHLLVVGELGVCVYLLLEDTQLVPDEHDLVKQRVE